MILSPMILPAVTGATFPGRNVKKSNYKNIDIFIY